MWITYIIIATVFFSAGTVFGGMLVATARDWHEN